MSPETIKRYWPVYLAAAIVLSALVVRGISAGGGGDTPEGPSPKRAMVLPKRIDVDAADFRPEELKQRATPAEKARGIIAAYEERLENNPDPMEKAICLQAMGNLYRQKLLDYEKAAMYYEWLIEDYPDLPQIGMIYSQVSLCYEKLEDQESANRLYQKMVRRFPEDSQEHLFAKQKLGW
jgi:tetratricopeptide (TPR) repeat protein